MGIFADLVPKKKGGMFADLVAKIPQNDLFDTPLNQFGSINAPVSEQDIRSAGFGMGKPLLEILKTAEERPFEGMSSSDDGRFRIRGAGDAWAKQERFESAVAKKIPQVALSTIAGIGTTVATGGNIIAGVGAGALTSATYDAAMQNYEMTGNILPFATGEGQDSNRTFGEFALQNTDAALTGATTTLSAVAPNMVTLSGIGKTTLASGVGAGTKEAAKQVGKRMLLSAGATLPDLARSDWRTGLANTVIQSSSEGIISGYGAGKAVYGGTQVAKNIAKYIPEADEISTIIREAGGNIPDAMMRDATFKNKTYNFIKNIFGGGSLLANEKANVELLTHYTNKFIEDITGGMPTEDAVRQMVLMSQKESVNSAINRAGSTVAMNQLKESAGIPLIKQMDDLTASSEKVVNSVLDEADEIIGTPIPRERVARSQFFEEKYGNIDDAVKSSGERVDFDKIKEEVGVAKPQATLSPKQQAILESTGDEYKSIVAQQLGVSSETFDEVFETGLREGFTDKTAQTLIRSIPKEYSTFKVLTDLRSKLGKAWSKASDDNARRILNNARMSLTSELDRVAQSAGVLDEWKNTTKAYSRVKLWDDLTDPELVKSLSDPVVDAATGTRRLSGKATTNYLFANKKPLVEWEGLSEEKFQKLYDNANELMKLQDKKTATKFAPDILKGLYDTPDQSTIQQASNLKSQMLDSLDKLTGTDAAETRRAIGQLDEAMELAAKKAGVYKEHVAAEQMIQKDRLRTRLREMANARVEENVSGSEQIIKGDAFLKQLESKGNHLVTDYGLSENHLNNLKAIARAIKISNQPRIGGKLIPKMMQISGTLGGITGGTFLVNPAGFAMAAANTGVMIGIPKLIATWLKSNPYILESNTATSILAKSLKSIDKQRNWQTVLAKTYLAWKKEEDSK